MELGNQAGRVFWADLGLGERVRVETNYPAPRDAEDLRALYGSGGPRLIHRDRIPRVREVEPKPSNWSSVVSPEIVSALDDYTNKEAAFDLAQKNLEAAESRVKKLVDGKLPIKVVIRNNFVVVAQMKQRISVHVTPLQGIFGQPGNPMPRGTV